MASRDVSQNPVCSLEDCWQRSRTKTEGGYCGACYEWWRRTRAHIPSWSLLEVEIYTKRLERFAARARVLRNIHPTKKQRRVA